MKACNVGRLNPLLAEARILLRKTRPTFLDSCDGLTVYGEKKIAGTDEIDNWLQELGF